MRVFGISKCQGTNLNRDIEFMIRLSGAASAVKRMKRANGRLLSAHEAR